MALNNFRYAITLALLTYDLDIQNDDDAIEIGLIAYNLIGNKRANLKEKLVDVDCNTGIIELPCDVDILEAVTYCSSEDWNYTSNSKEYGDQESRYIENYIEGLKILLDPIYVGGSYVNYRRLGNRLYIKNGLSKVKIVYYSLDRDEEGLPLINDKEALAISEYIAYTYKYKEAIKTNNPNILKIALIIKGQWLIHCDAARVPEYISLNDANKILDSIASGNRKIYNKSYKPTL